LASQDCDGVEVEGNKVDCDAEAEEDELICECGGVPTRSPYLASPSKANIAQTCITKFDEIVACHVVENPEFADPADKFRTYMQHFAKVKSCASVPVEIGSKLASNLCVA